MNTTFELNNAMQDPERKVDKKSPAFEVFSAMVNGRDIPESFHRNGKEIKGEVVRKHICNLGFRAESGDYKAVSELNTLRRSIIEEPMMNELKLLSVFGQYQNIGINESIQREVYKHVGERSRFQAEGNGDVPFNALTKEVYGVPTFNVSGGYAVDYRQVALGDMERENIGLNQVRIDIRNKIVMNIITKVYNAIKNAAGVKNQFEAAGLTKTGVDGLITKMRRFGKVTVLGDYALLSQFSGFAGYQTSINSNVITGISEKIMNEIQQNGIMGMYNGSILSEIPNQYNFFETNTDGTEFKTLYPVGLGFVVPTGINSPIATWTQGGLTSLTGNDVVTGKLMTRFDMTAAVDVAKGQEYMIGAMYDTNLGGLA